MSKMDDLRALREARYERTLARAAATRPTRAAAKPPTAPPARAAAPSTRADAAAGTAAGTAAETADDRCGHRNMSGRTCTRERGHAAKSHRYS